MNGLIKKFVKNFWSLNVDEALVANWLKNNLKKNYEVFFPINAQLEYIDLIVYNKQNKKTTTIQVKSSQSYIAKDKDGDYWVSGHRFESNKIKSKKVDFFIFTCFYPKTPKKNQPDRGIMEHYVVFKTRELEKYIETYKKIKITKTGKIGFSFYVYPPNDKGKLYEDWELKEEYTRNDYKKLDPISNVMDNFNKIKQELK